MLEEKIKKMIIEKYGSVRQFAMKINIPYTTIDTILKRGIDNSNVANVIKICKELNLSIDKLVDDNKLMEIDFDNANFIDISSETIQIPVLGVIKAGVAIEAQENIIDYVDIPKNMTKGGKTYYGLLISGDSMFPKYQEQDIVIFEKIDSNLEVANKKDCAVMVNGYDATFKNVSINQDGITLTPLNPYNSDGYITTTYSKEQVEQLPVRIIGIAKERRTKL